MVKSGLDFFILKFNEALQSCCCPVQKCAQKGWIGLASISEGAPWISKKKNLDHFSTLFFNQKCSFMTVDFSTLIERVLASVDSIRIMQWIKGSTQFYEILSFPNYVNVPKVSLYLKGIFPRLYTVQSWFSDIKFSDN